MTRPNCDLETFVLNHSLMLFDHRSIQMGLLRTYGTSRRESMVLMCLREEDMPSVEDSLIRLGVLSYEQKSQTNA